MDKKATEHSYPPGRILGIETSCDETAAAVVENGRIVLSNVVASQIDLHSQYGGVFPEVASRQHIRTIFPVIEEALSQAHLGLSDVDAIAVTQGPGLAGSLLVGINSAKGIALSTGLPIIGINHLEAHIYSAWLQFSETQKAPKKPQFPLLVLIVSGGHSELNLMTSHLTYQHLGGTLDDAAGEAFDKVARLLGLTYPGGPAIEKTAINGDPKAFNFPRSRLEGTWDFSFSGLKTAVMRKLRQFEELNQPLPVSNLAASFQAAVVDVLVSKTLQAAEYYHVRDIVVAGGVSANSALRDAFISQRQFQVHIPTLSLCTDNAAMVACAGYYHYSFGKFATLDMDVLPTWPLS